MANKKIWLGTLAAVFMFCLVISGCDNGLSPGGDENGNGNGNNGNGNGGNGGVIMRGAKLYDADDTFLGYSFLDQHGVTVISEMNHMYNIGWDGTFMTFNVYFTGEDGEGDKYVSSWHLPYGQYVYSYDNALYTYADFDANNLPMKADPPPNFKSHYNHEVNEMHDHTWPWGGSGNINDQFSPDAGADRMMALRIEQISRADAGIPETIALPLHFSFE